MADYTSGFTGAINDQSVRDYRGQQIQQMRQQAPILALKLKQEQDKMAARAALGTLLKSMNQGQIQPPPMIAPPPVGADEGPLPPGVGTPSVPMAPPVAAAPAAPSAPIGEQPVPPYQTLPQPPAETAPDQTGGDTELSAPPSEPMAGAGPAPAPTSAATAPAAPAAPQARTYSLPNIIKAMKAQGVPDTQVMDMLDELRPTMTAENQQELNTLKIHNTALQKAMDTYQKTIDLAIKQQRADTQGRDVDSKVQRRTDLTEQGQERIELARKKMAGSVGGPDNIKRSQPVFDADGTQTGWNVLTKGGQTRNFDLDGNPRVGTTGQPGPKADVNNLRKINSLNSRLNTLNNLIKRTAADVAEMENIKGQLREMGAKVSGGTAAPATPATSGAVPQRPAGVPTGSAYSPSRKQWKAPDGRKFTEAGIPIS